MVWITVNTDVNISGNYKIHPFLKHFWRSNPWNLRGSRAAAHAAAGTQGEDDAGTREDVVPGFPNVPMNETTK